MHPFSTILARMLQSRKCIHINLTHSCKSGGFKLSFRFRGNYTRINFVHNFGVEFASNHDE